VPKSLPRLSHRRALLQTPHPTHRAHCLPAHRGEAITDVFLEGPHSAPSFQAGRESFACSEGRFERLLAGSTIPRSIGHGLISMERSVQGR